MRNRLRFAGPRLLADEVLVSLVLGGQGAHQRSRVLLDALGGMQGLASASVPDLEQLGLGPAHAARLVAGMELGRRAVRRLPRRAPMVSSPADAWRFLRPHLEGLSHEEVHALYLSGGHRLIRWHCVAKGGPASAAVSPGEILAPALRCGASAVVLAHNHPSGSPVPSRADRELTRQLARSARQVGLEVLDHLVIGAGGYRSLAEEGILSRAVKACS